MNGKVMSEHTKEAGSRATKRLWAVGAAYAAGRPAHDLRVIAVVGAAGRTTTLKFIDAMLRQDGKSTTVLDGGDGHTVWQVQQELKKAKKQGVDHVLVEVTDDILADQVLAGVKLEMAVVTTLEGASDDYIRGVTALVASEPTFLVLNRDDARFASLDGYVAAAQKITYGVHDEAEAKMTHTKLYRKGTEVTVVIDHQTTLEMATALPGLVNARNLTAASAAVYLLGADLEAIQEGGADIETIPGNYQYVTTTAPYSMVVDAAETAESMTFLVESAKELTKRRLLVVLEHNEPRAGVLAVIQRHADRVFVVASEEQSTPGVTTARTHKEAVELAQRGAKQDDLVLVIGPEFVEHIEDTGADNADEQ